MASDKQSLSELAEQVQTDPELKQELVADPEGVLAKQALAPAAYTSDVKFYRIAMIGLISIIVLIIVVAAVTQIWKEKAISDWQSALATTALGGLVGLFAPPPGK
jgi:uncharacterized membrane protein